MGGVTKILVEFEFCKVNEYPWMTLLTITRGGVDIRCGGSLIADQWVVSAAHCFKDTDKGLVSTRKIRLILGEHDTSKDGETKIPRKEIKIEKIVLHKEAYEKENDIALLKLSKLIHSNMSSKSRR